MSISDQFFFSIYNHYKKRYKQLANKIAMVYIDLLQLSVLLLLGVFFAVFFSQMNVVVVNSEKAWTLYIIAALIICFKNWIQYSGKKRNVMNAKISNRKSKNYSNWLLWALPLLCIAMAIILSKAF